MMLPGVTVVPATVWLAVCIAMVGASNLHPSRLTPDQYGPLISHRHELHRGTEEDQPLSKFLNDSDEHKSIEYSAGLRPKGHGPAENQPVSISFGSYWKHHGAADQADHLISPRRSANTGTFLTPQELELLKHLEENSLDLRMGNTAAENFSPLLQDKQLLEYAGQQLLDQNINVQESSDPPRSPPHESPSQSEDPFVADDTFQDQGPGSVEIYKLDLLREHLLPKPMPTSKLPMNAKSKAPKKTIHSNEKTKTTEYKAASPKMFHKQSNSFDDHSSDTPPNPDPFSIGGVPELQVGCEGLAASRQKRSIDSMSKDQEGDLWSEVTPISLDLDYDLSEEKYEEMDELFKLKKLETTTKGMKQNRGDIEATLYAEFQGGEKRAEKLPVRGDLGESSATTNSATLIPMTVRNERKFEETRSFAKIKRSVQSEDTDVPTGERLANQMRKILWVKEPITNDPFEGRDPPNQQTWGFGENEGVLSSDELQTENQRRRQFYEKSLEQAKLRKQQESQLRGEVANRTNADIDRIRSDYEKLLEQRREDERRRVSQDPFRRQQEEERRRRLQIVAERNQREEEDRRRSEAFHRAREWTQQMSSPRPRWQEEEEEARRRQHEEEARRNQHEEEARRRQHEEEARRKQHEEEARRRQHEEELRRRQHEEELRRRQHEEKGSRRQQEQDRIELEARRREWMLKKHQKEEEERRKQARDRGQPSNASVSANENGPREQWEREQKLRDYIQRNRPVNVDGSADRWAQEANRRRLEEERKLQEYIRRNQPVQIPRNASNDWMMHRRKMEEAGRDDRSKYPSFGGGRRDHGPSATANVEPRTYEYEAMRRNTARKTEEERIRERERLEEQLLREEIRRRELEVQRLQSRRYEEQRQRIEAERRAAQEQAGKTSPLEDMSSPYGDRRQFEDHSRRQETSLVPANLLANEATRTAQRERQLEEQRRWLEEQQRRRTEESRRRVENARRRPGGNRAKEARENQERARDEKEQWRRQEVARLNALPVIARIIIRPGAGTPVPLVVPRTDFGEGIEYTGLNPDRKGAPVPNFPASPTRRPPVKSPPPCTWAVVQCCPSNIKRLVTCFESMGCPGINWDPNPCRVSVTKAARDQVMKFYEESNEDQRF